ncbi:MAG: hypothetical protein U9R42_00990 [Bacteroidota bacterium]|nr:hypothetical protein [Bacteroidota bacterium]
MNDILTYSDSSEEMIKVSSSEFYKDFSCPTNNGNITIQINTTQSKLRNIINYASFQNKKDEYFIKAIKNLLKKSNFQELSLEISEDQITEEEYYKELEKNPEKYVLDLEYLKDPNDIKIINEIVKRIGVEFSIDEVEELFSLVTGELENKVNQIEI